MEDVDNASAFGMKYILSLMLVNEDFREKMGEKEMREKVLRVLQQKDFTSTTYLQLIGLSIDLLNKSGKLEEDLDFYI